MFHSSRVTYLADALWVSRWMLSSGSIVFAWKPSIRALRSSWEVSAVRRWKSVAALCCSSLAALVPHLLFAVTCKGGTKPSLFTETKSGEGMGGAMQCELGAAIAGRAWGAQSSAACTGAALPAAEQSPELPPLLLSLGCQTLLAARADPAMLPSMPPPPSRGDGAANPRAVTSGQTLELPLGGWLPFSMCYLPSLTCFPLFGNNQLCKLSAALFSRVTECCLLPESERGACAEVLSRPGLVAP